MKPSDLVKVKALEWEEYNRLGCEMTVGACLGLYAIDPISDPRCVWASGEGFSQPFNSKPDAKAACQAHYESMVLSLLEVK